jgi:hypothetical protein
MASVPVSFPSDYWTSFQINSADVEFIQNHLFEVETPLTAKELLTVLVEERIRKEKEAQLKEKKGGGKVFVPKEKYAAGEKLVFPALDWAAGEVTAVRPGVNPDAGEFDVLTVAMPNGDRMFAANLADHALNEVADTSGDDNAVTPGAVLAEHGAFLAKKLEQALSEDENLVRIAGRWFPRPLLVDVNVGHLNLAEAVLDMAGGKPLSVTDLLKEIDLSDKDDSRLVEFSANYALQEDERFDEVGPAGEVLWCLNRLEPEAVRETPLYLQYEPVEYDRSTLTEDMLALEAEIDDELSELETPEADQDKDEVSITLIYPHWRMGTLPLSDRVKPFFPTAYESPRIRFTLVDGKTGDKMPAWVVRGDRYVYGLEEWYRSQELIPGSVIKVRRGKKAGEVIVDLDSRRTSRDWMRTALVGADGVMVFALLKQVVSVGFNDRMSIVVPDTDAVDQVWTKAAKNRPPLEKQVLKIMRELTKLNPQGHIHAQELYAAVNILRRCPPAPLFSLLGTSKNFVHIGDLHFRLNEEELGEV